MVGTRSRSLAMRRRGPYSHKLRSKFWLRKETLCRRLGELFAV